MVFKLLARETDWREYLPYRGHLNEQVILLTDGSLMTTLELDGFAFESASAEDVNSMRHRLNALWRNVSHEQLTLTVVVRRRQVDAFPESSFTNRFCRSLNEAYRARVEGDRLYRNRLTLTLVWMPVRQLGKKSVSYDHDVELKLLEERVANILAMLQPLGIRRCGVTAVAGVLFCEQSHLLHELLGGVSPVVPVTRGSVSGAVYSDRLIFRGETAEIRLPDKSRYAALLAYKEYPNTTMSGMLNELMATDCELTVVQTFRFLGKSAGREALSLQQKQMVSANDKAISQVVELSQAMDDLEGNRWVLGEHNMSVAVFGATTKRLSDDVAAVRAAMLNGGSVVVREDMGLESSWWAQLPGCGRHRLRSAVVTSDNFAALAPFHSYPVGRADGNAWGPAVTMFRTVAGSPFYFSFHAPDLGNSLIVGPSGSGKTVAMNFLLAQAQKHGADTVCFDKDRGMDVFIRAAGGRYFPLKSGVSTGFAPLKAVAFDESGCSFLSKWLVMLAGKSLSVEEEAMLAQAVAMLADVPVEHRSFGALRVYLHNDDPNGLSARLQRWERGNALGWVFDNATDDVGSDTRFVGFDMTEFLDDAEVRGPLMMYLMARQESRFDGRRVMICIDEAWKALQDVEFRKYIADKLKTIRKQNGFLVLASQSPADFLKSGIAETIFEQCPTRLLFPNARADADDYIGGLKVTAREFQLLQRDITPESRCFLVKQGVASVVVSLDLNGFDDLLSVLSGRTANLEVVERVIREFGGDPEMWLPEFYKMRRRA
jgi:type IV secretion system protein VirB4